MQTQSRHPKHMSLGHCRPSTPPIERRTPERPGTGLAGETAAAGADAEGSTTKSGGGNRATGVAFGIARLVLAGAKCVVFFSSFFKFWPLCLAPTPNGSPYLFEPGIPHTSNLKLIFGYAFCDLGLERVEQPSRAAMAPARFACTTCPSEQVLPQEFAFRFSSQ